MVAREVRDVAHGVELMDCVAGLDGLAMDVMETLAAKEGTFASQKMVNRESIIL